MFLIKVNQVKHMWSNKVEDDFLRFLPEHFGVSKEEISVEFIPAEATKWLDADKKQFLDLQSDGLAKKIKVIPATETEPEQIEYVGEPIALLKLKKWPYDEQGNFLGHEFE